MNGISDGFGDLTDAEVVAQFRRWSYKVAHSFTDLPPGLGVDDLAQESLIAMWAAMDKKGGHARTSATYLTTVGRYQMLKVAHGKPLTGGDHTPGPKHRPHTHATDFTDDEATAGLRHLLVAADLLDAAAWAYHHGQIAAALAALAPADRAYVHQRFWEGKTDTEIAAEHGTATNKTLQSRWRRTIRPALAEHLRHLTGAVS